MSKSVKSRTLESLLKPYLGLLLFSSHMNSWVTTYTRDYAERIREDGGVLFVRICTCVSHRFITLLWGLFLFHSLESVILHGPMKDKIFTNRKYVFLSYDVLSVSVKRPDYHIFFIIWSIWSLFCNLLQSFFLVWNICPSLYVYHYERPLMSKSIILNGSSITLSLLHF